MAWIYLLVAGVFEIAWAMSMKLSQGFTQFWPSVACFVLAVITISTLNKAMVALPVGTAYAVWMAIGTIGTAIFGIVLFRESASWPRLACIGLIAAGAIGLKLLEKP